MSVKRIAILGATGSIGRQTLKVIEENLDSFEVTVLTARQNVDLLSEQALIFKPKHVVIDDHTRYCDLKKNLFGHDIQVWQGDDSLESVVQISEIDIVVMALVGYAGFLPTVAALKAGKTIALANKETLVVGGQIIMSLARRQQLNIYPIDSEHSAIFQCLQGEDKNNIEKLILTASGGPFRTTSLKNLEQVTVEQALKHPNWDMGTKITIDSATMMNKGFEMIEARWLFNIPADQIDIVVHPQSVIHSMVQFHDSSIMGQIGYPDMRLPIIYALGYPARLKTSLKRFNFLDYPNLSFEQPDKKRFHNLILAYEASKKGGNMPCILNAANEISVARFIDKKISFLDIAKINERCMEKMTFIENPSYEDLIETHHNSQELTKTLIIKRL